MDMLKHIFSPFLPVVFTVLRTYILVTTVMGNYRPINLLMDMLTHIFSPFLPVVYLLY